MKAVNYFSDISPIRRQIKKRKIAIKELKGKYPIGLFNGASQRRGCGVVIILEPGRLYHFWWKGGQGINSRAQIIALWGALQFAEWLRQEQIYIHGDAKRIIDKFTFMEMPKAS